MIPNWHRYDAVRYTDQQLMLVRYEYPVLKITRCGVWLDIYGQARFVLLTARKRYACPTEAEALASYHTRKKRQVKILSAQLRQAETARILTKEGEIRYVPA